MCKIFRYYRVVPIDLSQILSVLHFKRRIPKSLSTLSSCTIHVWEHFYSELLSEWLTANQFVGPILLASFNFSLIPRNPSASFRQTISHNHPCFCSDASVYIFLTLLFPWHPKICFQQYHKFSEIFEIAINFLFRVSDM